MLSLVLSSVPDSCNKTDICQKHLLHCVSLMIILATSLSVWPYVFQHRYPVSTSLSCSYTAVVFLVDNCHHVILVAIYVYNNCHWVLTFTGLYPKLYVSLNGVCTSSTKDATGSPSSCLLCKNLTRSKTMFLFSTKYGSNLQCTSYLCVRVLIVIRQPEGIYNIIHFLPSLQIKEWKPAFSHPLIPASNQAYIFQTL